MPRVFCLALLLLALSCSGPSEQEQQSAPKKAPAPAVTAVDQSHRFPKQGRVNMDFVEDHLLGKAYLPGGNVAEYERDGKTYLLFLTRAESPDKAAFLLLDFKNDLQNAKYVPHFGGYFGKEGDQPVFVFAKKRWLAGVIGLEQEAADEVGRGFAAALD